MTQTYSKVTDVTCPFCGLLCDDLTVQTGSHGTQVAQNGCVWAKAGFAQSPGPASSCVSGRPCSADRAIDQAVRILRGARQPLIAGMATDAAGCRAAMALAEKTGAAVDHLHGNAISSNSLVLQRRGWIMTTLTEVRNRADLVVLLGVDADSVNPRFIERCLRPRPGMGRHPGRNRKVVFVGEAAQARSLRRALPAAMTIPCRKRDLLDLLGTLRTLIHGFSGELPVPRSLNGILPAVRKLAELLRSADYAVCAWAPGQLLPDQADIVIESICGMVAELNSATRAAGLALGGNDGAVTATNVCAWQTGYPLRVNFAAGAPEYNPSRNSTDSLLHRHEADVLVWISTFQPLPPPGKGVPSIVLAPPSRRLARLADVYFPVSIPGVDAAGTMFRLDSVVGLPLRQVRDSGLPSATEILTRITGGM